MCLTKPKEKIVEQELRITTAAVLNAAKTCPTAKATLEALFPEAFKSSQFNSFSSHGTISGMDLGASINGRDNITIITGRVGDSSCFWLAAVIEGRKVSNWSIKRTANGSFELYPEFEPQAWVAK